MLIGWVLREIMVLLVLLLCQASSDSPEERHPRGCDQLPTIAESRRQGSEPSLAPCRSLLASALVVGRVDQAVGRARGGGRRERIAPRRRNLPTLAPSRADLAVLATAWCGSSGGKILRILAHQCLSGP